jgi:hypothetical protein
MIARFRHNYLLGQRGQDANAGLGNHQPRKKPGSRNMQTDQWITLFTPHKEL